MAWFGIGCPAGAAAQATTERVVVNRVSGYAINGFDPVAYFTDGGPKSGQGSFETVHDGALWRFRNEGNLAAFKAHPKVYAPLFGAYDPVEVARGKVIAGLPGIWAVVDTHLMLFSNLENRTILLGSSQLWLAQAANRWPALRQQLAR